MELSRKEKFSNRRSLGFLLGALAFFVLLLILPRPSGLSASGQRVIAVVITVVLLWATEALPVALSSILALVLLATTRGVSSTADLFAGFASPLPYFLLAILVMSQAVRKSGLADRMAGWLIRGGTGHSGRLYLKLFLSMPFLALVLPSAITRNAILIPAYEKGFRRLGLARGDPLPRGILLSLGVLHPLASSALLTGGINSMTTATLLGGFSWLRWFVLMALPYWTLLAVGGGLLSLLYRQKKMTPLESSRTPTGAGRLSRTESKVLLIVGATSVLWLTDFVHGLNPVIPALLAAAVLLLPYLGILGWKDFEESASWSMFLVLGVSLTLAQALSSSGAAQWFAREAILALSARVLAPEWILVFLVVLVSVVHLTITNMTACISLLIPVAATFGRSLGLNPVVLGLIVGISVDAVILYPLQTTTNLMAYQLGYFSAWDVFKVGVLMLILTALVVAFLAVPYWRALGLAL